MKKILTKEDIQDLEIIKGSYFCFHDQYEVTEVEPLLIPKGLTRKETTTKLLSKFYPGLKGVCVSFGDNEMEIINVD